MRCEAGEIQAWTEQREEMDESVNRYKGNSTCGEGDVKRGERNARKGG